MAEQTTKPITKERVETLIDCYGGSPMTWPENERAAAQELLAHTPSLQRKCELAKRLDEVLTQHRATISDHANTNALNKLQTHILRQLDEQDVSGTGAPRRFQAWMGMAAGITVIALAAVLYLSLPLSLSPDRPTDAANSFDHWAWSESLDQPGNGQPDEDVGVVALLMPELLPDFD